MSDDLKKRLRRHRYNTWNDDLGPEPDKALAADRIEQLERERDEAVMTGHDLAKIEYRDLVSDLEAKLAKAVEALREIITRWDTPSWKDAEATGSIINRARTVLAELEGGE